MTREEAIARFVEREIERDKEFISLVTDRVCIFCDPFHSAGLCSDKCSAFRAIEAAEEDIAMLQGWE